MGKLVLNKLTKEYPTARVVNEVSLTVEDGELLTIVGPSGCGKTTILRMVAGFIEPTGGRIELNNQVFFEDGLKKQINPEKRNIGMVFQSYAVWPHMNVYDNVAYPLKIKKIPKDQIEESVHKTLRIVHLDKYENRMAHELSGGQQQRVALARALIMNPDLLLLDEPLSNLDAALREQMRAEIKDLQRELGITIINVTHDQIEAMTMSDKVAVMNEGDLIQFGTPEDLYENPVNTFVAKFIGSANILPATLKENGISEDKKMMEVIVNNTYPMLVPYIENANTEGFVGFRSHHIRPNNESLLVAKVKQRLYQGNQFEYHFLLEGNVECKVMLPVTEHYEVDNLIGLTIEKGVWLND